DVARSQHSVYPVVSLEGQVSGLVATDRLLRVPAGEREGWRVHDITVPITLVATAEPDEILTDALDRQGGRLPVLVIEGGYVVGIVTNSDVTRIGRRAAAL